MATDQALVFLVVEDDPVTNQHISHQLRGLGHHVVGQAFDRREAVELTKQEAPDVVLMDLHMWDPETQQENHQAGVEAARLIQTQCPTPVIVLTAYDATDLIQEATEAGIGAYLLKPPDPQEIERAARIAIARFDDMQALRRLNIELEMETAARRRALIALREHEIKLRSILDATTAAVVLLDQRGVVLDANRVYPKRFGLTLDEIIGRCVWDMFPPAVTARRKPLVEGAFATGQPVRTEDERDGMWNDYVIYPVKDSHGNARSVAVYAQDITERKHAEARLRDYADQLECMVEEKVRQLEEERAKAIQLDKLAALGEMATGVAHELREPLTAIGFEADYLKMIDAKAREQHAGDLNAVLGDGALQEIGENLARDLVRCQRLIDHLREFGRISNDDPALINLNRPIQESLIIVGAQLRNRSVDVQLDLTDDLPAVLADPYRVEQVILNLLNNADYAMERRAAEQPGHQRELKIATTATEDKVIITVCDNGCGMREDVRTRIFDPFFTTKPPGEGTGLGLSMSYGIVTDYGGEIACESVEGEGTAFTLRFPVAEINEGSKE